MRARILIWFWYQLRQRMIKRIQEGQVARPGLAVSSIHKLKQKHSTSTAKFIYVWYRGNVFLKAIRPAPWNTGKQERII